MRLFLVPAFTYPTVPQEQVGTHLRAEAQIASTLGASRILAPSHHRRPARSADSIFRGTIKMTATKWWLRIVGTLYLLEGGGITLMALLAPQQFAAMWAVAPVGSIDPLGVRAALIGGLPGVLTWVLLGAMAWIYSGAPARGRMLIVVIAAWELLVWIPVDVVST